MPLPYLYPTSTLTRDLAQLRPRSEYVLEPSNPLSRDRYSLITLAPDKPKPRRKRAPRKVEGYCAECAAHYGPTDQGQGVCDRGMPVASPHRAKVGP